MQIDREDIRRHYASMSDEELLELNRDELTAVAQQCYDHEMERRQLADSPEVEQALELGEAGHIEIEEDPDWLESAAVACSFTAYPGAIVAPEAAQACDALRAAGIPCHMHEASPQTADEDSQQYTEFQVMVPGALTLMAASVLDKEIFNPKQEEDWRAHLAQLSDDELRVLTPAVICAGYLDRAARLKRAYEEEMERRA